MSSMVALIWSSESSPVVVAELGGGAAVRAAQVAAAGDLPRDDARRLDAGALLVGDAPPDRRRGGSPPSARRRGAGARRVRRRMPAGCPPGPPGRRRDGPPGWPARDARRVTARHRDRRPPASPQPASASAISCSVIVASASSTARPPRTPLRAPGPDARRRCLRCQPSRLLSRCRAPAADAHRQRGESCQPIHTEQLAVPCSRAAHVAGLVRAGHRRLSGTTTTAVPYATISFMFAAQVAAVEPHRQHHVGAQLRSRAARAARSAWLRLVLASSVYMVISPPTMRLQPRDELPADAAAAHGDAPARAEDRVDPPARRRVERGHDRDARVIDLVARPTSSPCVRPDPDVGCDRLLLAPATSRRPWRGR